MMNPFEIPGASGFGEMTPEALESFIEADYERRLRAIFDAPIEHRQTVPAVLVGLADIPPSIDWTLLDPYKFMEDTGGEKHIADITYANGEAIINSYKPYTGIE